MYTGHVALALGTRGVRRDLPLFVLVFASQGYDWVELGARLFLSRRAAEVYSHAFPFTLVAASCVALAVWLWKRSVSAALTVMALYLSHGLADYVTGLKPLWWGGPPVGLQLIERPVADFIVQATVCVVGFAVYVRSLAVRRTSLVRFAVGTPLILLLSLQAVSDFLVYLQVERRQRSSLDTPS